MVVIENAVKYDKALSKTSILSDRLSNCNESFTLLFMNSRFTVIFKIFSESRNELFENFTVVSNALT